MRTIPPPLPAREVRVSPWPLGAALLVGALLGAALAGWWYERAGADLRVTVAEAKIVQAQAAGLIKVLEQSAMASLKACEGAMPVSVAQQRTAMLKELKAAMKNPPTGVGGGP